MTKMERYSLITTKMAREFVLLQGSGCCWRRCTFCDYHTDTSEAAAEINREVLMHVTGETGVLDVINSGSAIELDEDTLALIGRIIEEKHIHTLWVEMHWMYRHQLAKFASRFPTAKVKFRCGIETFDPQQRQRWNKGVGADVTAEEVARYFQGVCLLCCVEGQSKESIREDIRLAEKHFEYFSVNLFCNNMTKERRDEKLAEWFEEEIYPTIKDAPQIEVLLNNTDLGVG